MVNSIIYENGALLFESDKFIRSINMDEIPEGSYICTVMDESIYIEGTINIQYALWTTGLKYRDLIKEYFSFCDFRNQFAVSRQYRSFLKAIELEKVVHSKAHTLHTALDLGRTILNRYGIVINGIEHINKYVFGTVAGRFINISEHGMNLQAIPKDQRSDIKSMYTDGKILNVDMKSFHINILKRLSGLENIPNDPYLVLSEKMGIDRNEAKLLLLRIINDANLNVTKEYPQFVHDIITYREQFNTVKGFTYYLQLMENTTMCKIINNIHDIIQSLEVNAKIINYCYDSITIDTDWKGVRVFEKIVTEYRTKIFSDYPIEFNFGHSMS